MSKERDGMFGLMSNIVRNAAPAEGAPRTEKKSPDVVGRGGRGGRPRKGDPRYAADWFITSLSVDRNQWDTVGDIMVETGIPTFKFAMKALLSCAIDRYNADPEAFRKEYAEEYLCARSAVLMARSQKEGR